MIREPGPPAPPGDTLALSSARRLVIVGISSLRASVKLLLKVPLFGLVMSMSQERSLLTSTSEAPTLPFIGVENLAVASSSSRTANSSLALLVALTTILAPFPPGTFPPLAASNSRSLSRASFRRSNPVRRPPITFSTSAT